MIENIERGSGLMIQPGGTKGSILIGKITMVSHSRLRRGAEGGFLIGKKHCVGGHLAPRVGFGSRLGSGGSRGATETPTATPGGGGTPPPTAERQNRNASGLK